MTECNGNGECLFQCECECYNEETEEYNEECICGHREHNGYCPSNCCIPIKCRNYKYCNEKLPFWVLCCNNGMCINCAIQFGKHTFTNKDEECGICLENNKILILKCNHKICNDCWYNITKYDYGTDEHKPLCPFCRNYNDWN
jgi:hypothetical protein